MLTTTLYPDSYSTRIWFFLFLASTFLITANRVLAENAEQERISVKELGSKLDQKARWVDGHYSLSGEGNNRNNPAQGASGTQYSRKVPAVYADGLSAMVEGPELRYLSNRIFADGAQNLFSPNGATQWVYNWGQFLDHSIGLREAATRV